MFLLIRKGASMNFVRNTLLVILFIQFLIFLYVKLIYEPNLTDEYQSNNPNIQQQMELDALVQASVHEIMDGAKELPQSSEYTLWDKEMIDGLNKEIEAFNDEIRKVVHQNTPEVPLEILASIPIKKEVIVNEKVSSKTVPQQSIVKKPVEKERTPEKVKITQKVKTKPKVKKKKVFKVSVTKKIEKYAKGKLGKKYVWGAVGPKTFDCSGFTKNVFKCTTGIKIPRVSRDQAKVGTYVKYKDLRRGDMVFFDTEKKYTGKVNHVGIYLSDNNFIHASSAKKKVIITNFKKKPFYKKRFLWGRRIVKNSS